MTTLPNYDDWKTTKPAPTSFECSVCHKDKEKWELYEDHDWACAGCVEEMEFVYCEAMEKMDW